MRKKKQSMGCLGVLFFPISLTYMLFKWLLKWESTEVQTDDLPKPRKSCRCCGSRHLAKIGHLVEEDFEGVIYVDEDYEHNFTKPGPVEKSMNLMQWIKLSILLSLFFTPFAGPFMALAIKILYDGTIDKELTNRIWAIWANQKFCFECGKTWKESIDFSK
jgi:hypothetical protein